jgi:hypothetical protein
MKNLTFIILIVVVIFGAFQIMNLVKGQELSPPLSEEEEKYCESRYGDNITRCVTILDRMTPEERQYCDGSYQDYEDAGMNVICPPFLAKSLELDKEKEEKEPLSGIIRDTKNMSGLTAEDKKQQEKVENYYFSINIPDSWAYIESSDTPQAETTGYGPANNIQLTPKQFSDLLITPSEKFWEKMKDGGAYASFYQDVDYRIKNAPLESYVKYVIDNRGIVNITSQQYTTVGNEKAVRIYTNETTSYGNTSFVRYLVMDDDEKPYHIMYFADAKNYEKYLPEFEQMVKSLRFVDGALSESDGNLTNTKTNFSGANLTELSNRDTSNNRSPEELYNECVGIAGKSLCDFLFRR